MLTIALTGGIGSGKSTVSTLLRGLGAEIFDVDEAARSVLAPGSPGVDDVAARWPEVVTSGVVDRAALARIVFNDPAELAHLNAIVHPRTWEKIDADLAEYRRAHPDGVAIVDIALLATSERRDSFDLRVVVHADVETRVRRLTETRGMDEADARARIAAQVDESELRALADVWLDNSGTPEDLHKQVEAFWATISQA
ncbi:MAG: dephospho-CoA kinase [Ancrocorticia sp.]